MADGRRDAATASTPTIIPIPTTLSSANPESPEFAGTEVAVIAVSAYLERHYDHPMIRKTASAFIANIEYRTGNGGILLTGAGFASRIIRNTGTVGSTWPAGRRRDMAGGTPALQRGLVAHGRRDAGVRSCNTITRSIGWHAQNEVMGVGAGKTRPSLCSGTCHTVADSVKLFFYNALRGGKWGDCKSTRCRTARRRDGKALFTAR